MNLIKKIKEEIYQEKFGEANVSTEYEKIMFRQAFQIAWKYYLIGATITALFFLLSMTEFWFTGFLGFGINLLLIAYGNRRMKSHLKQRKLR